MKIELDEVMKILENGWRLYRCDPTGYQSYMKGFIDGWRNYEKLPKNSDSVDDCRPLDEDLIYEPYSGQYFNLPPGSLAIAVFDARHRIEENGKMSLNEWKTILGLKGSFGGALMGWEKKDPLFNPQIVPFKGSTYMISYKKSVPHLFEGGITNETH